MPEPTASVPKKRARPQKAKGKPPKVPRRTSDPDAPLSKRKTPERGFCADVADYMRTPSEPPGPPSWMNGGLFSSLHALDVAVSAVSAGSSSDFALVAAAAIRCVDVLHGVLVRATAPALDTPQDPTPREALNGIGRTLPRIICTAINILGRAEVVPSSAAGLRWYADATEGGASAS